MLCLSAFTMDKAPSPFSCKDSRSQAPYRDRSYPKSTDHPLQADLTCPGRLRSTSWAT